LKNAAVQLELHGGIFLSQGKKLVQPENSIFAICNSTLLPLH
jgi:hypothetical protein